MNSALWKDNLRTLKDSLPRFLSIFAIIALGVAFFIGIRAAGPSMEKTAQQYYEAYNLPDGHVLSNVGLNEDDMAVLMEQEGFRWAPMQSFDTVLSPSEETTKVFTYNGDESTNFFQMMEGRMVEASDEIVLDNKYKEHINSQLSDSIEIGDTVTVDYEDVEGGISLAQQEFEVVGFARTPLYIERTARSGSSSVFAIVSDEATSGDIYTEAYYWIEEAEAYAAYTEEYEDVVEATTVALETSLEGMPEIRLAQIKQDANDEIAEGREEINDAYLSLVTGQEALSEASSAIAESKTDLEKGQLTLAEGRHALDEGRLEYQDGLRAYEASRKELADAEAQLDYNEALYQAGLDEYMAGLATFNDEIANAEAQLTDAQAQLDQAAGAAQGGLQQLIEGQAALDAGYAQLEAGRQELLDQIRLATNDQIDPEELLAQLEGQISNINDFLAMLEEANMTLDNPEIADWIAGLINERKMLTVNLTSLTGIIAELPARNASIAMTPRDILSQEQVTALESILGISLNENIAVENLLPILNERVANIEAILIEVETAEDNNEAFETNQGNTSNPKRFSIMPGGISGVNWPNYNRNHVENLLDYFQSSKTENLPSMDEVAEELSPYFPSENYNPPEETEEETYGDEDSEDGDDSEEEQESDESAEEPINPEEPVLPDLPNIPVPSDPAEIEALVNQLQMLLSAIEQLQAAQTELDSQSANLSAGWDEYYAGLAQLEAGQAAINQGWTELSVQRAAGESQLAEAEVELDEGRQALDEGQAQLSEGRQELLDARRTLDEAYDEIMAGEAELETARLDIISGQIELLRGEQILMASQTEFAEAAEDAIGELRQGEVDLNEAEETLAELDEPIYMVEDRSNASSYQGLGNNAQQLRVISNIFPVFFFAIAILVTYTTIKRMAQEQRNYMGTMKQMGYDNGAILSKFVTYAGLAGGLGTIAGLIIGYAVFPRVVIGAYNTMYYFDNPQVSILWDWNILASLVAMATALIPAIWTPLKMLQTKPAQLLIPESPKAGKKLFIERIPAIWNRISFYNKMTIRNLLRYKGRNFMTFLGVAGCTMLIVTGYGIADTINGLVDIQFNEIQHFDSMAYLDGSFTEAELLDTASDLQQVDGVEAVMPMMVESYDIEWGSGQTQSVSVTVPLGTQADFQAFVTLRQRGEEPTTLTESGPFTTERLQELLNLSPGDEIELIDDDFNRFYLSDYNVAENYVAHYLYMTPDQYEGVFAKEPEANLFYVNYTDDVARSEIDDGILENENIMTTLDIQSLASGVQDSLESLDMITLVLIISAAALSFVVLYNLTNINVAERMRELSTFKVLGFYNHEVSMYIFNEVLVLTFLGSAVGLGLGRILTQYLMKTMQMNDVLFYPQISLPSYFQSFIISFIFSSIVMLAMHQKLKKIDMVEAMKAVD